MVDQKQFYQSYYHENPNYTFAEKGFDGSPLNRVLKQGFPGEPWNIETGRFIETIYKSNVEGHEVFIINVSENGEMSKSGWYSSNRLHKTKTINENHNITITYSDLLNRTILQDNQRSSSGNSFYTYYAYDNLGNLRFVIPPKAFAYLFNASNSEVINLETDWVNDLCYYWIIRF